MVPLEMITTVHPNCSLFKLIYKSSNTDWKCSLSHEEELSYQEAHFSPGVPILYPIIPRGLGKSTTCLDKGHGNGRENGFSELMFQEEQEILPTDLYEMAAGRKIMPAPF